MAEIYALCDPRTNEPFYVGSTGKKLSARLAEHKSKGVNDRMCLRFEELRDAGLSPVIVGLESVRGDDPSERERVWIQQLVDEGSSLLNMRIPAAGDSTVAFRVTQQQHQRIVEAAQARNLSVSAFCHAAVFGDTPIAPELEAFAQRVYNALEPRLSQLEEQIKRATSYIREDEDGNSN